MLEQRTNRTSQAEFALLPRKLFVTSLNIPERQVWTLTPGSLPPVDEYHAEVPSRSGLRQEDFRHLERILAIGNDPRASKIPGARSGERVARAALQVFTLGAKAIFASQLVGSFALVADR